MLHVFLMKKFLLTSILPIVALRPFLFGKIVKFGLQ